MVLEMGLNPSGLGRLGSGLEIGINCGNDRGLTRIVCWVYFLNHSLRL